MEDSKKAKKRKKERKKRKEWQRNKGRKEGWKTEWKKARKKEKERNKGRKKERKEGKCIREKERANGPTKEIELATDCTGGNTDASALFTVSSFRYVRLSPGLPASGHVILYARSYKTAKDASAPQAKQPPPISLYLD